MQFITHSARNGHLYTMDRHNGQIIGAKPYMEVNWTKGIDQKTGRSIEYDPTKDIQTYAGVGNLTPCEPLKQVCPSIQGGNNYWPSSITRSIAMVTGSQITAATMLLAIMAMHKLPTGCTSGTSNARHVPRHY